MSFKGTDGNQEEIFGSAYASAVYISKVLKMPKDKKVYVIGQAGLEEELDKLNIARCGGTVRYPSC
jgi:4-nitrophenyl phosphatase